MAREPIDVSRFWNWLPQFLAIAETLHLPTAAKRVHVTPPALSRTLRLLEDAIGRPLFHRRRGRLVLTNEGKLFLEATKRATRAMDEVYRQVHDAELEGPFRLAVGGVAVPFVMKALLAMVETYPKVVPEWGLPDSDQAALLWSGALDVLISSSEVTDPNLVRRVLGYERSSVYCGRLSPLYGAKTPSIKTVQHHPFVGPPLLDGRLSPDGWPEHLPRDVVFRVDRMALGIEVCASSALLAVLPDAIVRRSGRDLYRLPLRSFLPKTPIIAFHVPQLSVTGRTSLLLEAVAQQLTSR